MPLGASAAASAGSSIAGGILGSSAAGSAAKAANAANAKNQAIDQSVMNQTNTNFQPYENAGTGAAGILAGLTGAGGNKQASDTALNSFLNSENYQFQLGQGENAIEYANAPAFNSGATAKALTQYAEGQAGTALQGYVGDLQGEIGTGVNASSQVANTGTALAGLENSSNNSAAGVQGSADLASANSLTNALKGLTGTAATQATSSSYGTPAGSGTNPISQGVTALSNFFSPPAASASAPASGINMNPEAETNITNALAGLGG